MHRFVSGLRCHPRRTQWAACAIAVVLSGAVYRPVVNEVFPIAIARFRSYDADADRRQFEDAVHWGRIHFGRGDPWIEVGAGDHIGGGITTKSRNP